MLRFRPLQENWVKLNQKLAVLGHLLVAVGLHKRKVIWLIYISTKFQGVPEGLNTRMLVLDSFCFASDYSQHIVSLQCKSRVRLGIKKILATPNPVRLLELQNTVRRIHESFGVI